MTINLAGSIWDLAIAIPKEFTPFGETLNVLEGLVAQGYWLGIITNLRGDLGRWSRPRA